ncbi:MAG: Mov34/MPN/PAD-1 family protein, partial [Muribaculaceae bacterium]|nr:Mov34/MPN/PAD-1 family protein [Muribaculaceae bacterium]
MKRHIPQALLLIVCWLFPAAMVIAATTPETAERVTQNSHTGIVPIEQMADDFRSFLESHDFYGAEANEQRRAYYDKLVEELAGMNDEERKAYATTNGLQAYMEQERQLIQDLGNQKLDLVDDFLSDTYPDNAIADRKQARTELGKILTEQLDKRNHQLAAIGKMANVGYNDVSATEGSSGSSLLVVLLAVLAAVCGAGYWLYRRKGQGKSPATPHAPTMSNRPVEAATAPTGSDGIVVRRRTTSVLKHQDISDVVDNDSYLCIETSNMCPDSAVRRIYIKNTCVKDIYNMYAEDLRNAANPKEDGCMVLGRWILDGQSDQYDVTLEEIVLPGDDAVFAEYELNFGGKIKLSVADKLRRLRRESNLQYDLTCWVHSHPGLGVFFSNSDNNVHNQLKHPTQPHFLTAMVVDILTPDQTVGIFTFKRNGEVSSQADLRRMYSLEEMYQWAIASERSGFNAQEHFNLLSLCDHSNECSGVQLSNGAVIDIMQLTTSPVAGLAGYVHGFARIGKEQRTEYIADAVRRERSVAGKERVGCIVVDTHCSLPTVRRMVADELSSLHFVLVYATGNDELTVIPVI